MGTPSIPQHIKINSRKKNEEKKKREEKTEKNDGISRSLQTPTKLYTDHLHQTRSQLTYGYMRGLLEIVNRLEE